MATVIVHYSARRKSMPTHTACGTHISALRHSERLTNKLSSTSCEACLKSDECKAQSMEEALAKPGVVLIDDLEVVHRAWRTDECIRHFVVRNSTDAARTYRLKRADGLVIMQFLVMPGHDYLWNATPDTEF